MVNTTLNMSPSFTRYARWLDAFVMEEQGRFHADYVYKVMN